MFYESLRFFSFNVFFLLEYVKKKQILILDLCKGEKYQISNQEKKGKISFLSFFFFKNLLFGKRHHIMYNFKFFYNACIWGHSIAYTWKNLCSLHMWQHYNEHQRKELHTLSIYVHNTYFRLRFGLANAIYVYLLILKVSTKTFLLYKKVIFSF